MNKIKVVHIVPMLSPGGAERVAVHIVRGLSRQRYEPIVISFTGRLGCDLVDCSHERVWDSIQVIIHNVSAL